VTAIILYVMIVTATRAGVGGPRERRSGTGSMSGEEGFRNIVTNIGRRLPSLAATQPDIQHHQLDSTYVPVRSQSLYYDVQSPNGNVIQFQRRTRSPSSQLMRTVLASMHLVHEPGAS
jgi:hypothetical protein